jgi:hypothetical protein
MSSVNEFDIKSEFQMNYLYARDYWAPFVKDAQVYTLAASGYTWSDTERKSLIKEGRQPYELNIMRRPLQFFSGYLRDNINEVIYEPLEGSDQKTADQFTKLSYYVWDKGKGFQKTLDGADESWKAGISLVGIQMDYSKDFIHGDISFWMRTYNQFYLDPTFTTIDLKDCSFAITRDLIDKQYAKQLLPFIDPEWIEELAVSYRDDKFLTYHPDFETFSRKRTLLAYDQYYKRKTRQREMLCDMSSCYYKDITNYSKEEKDKLKFGIARFNRLRDEEDINRDEIPELEIRKVERPYVELNVMLNGQRCYYGEDKTGVTHTYPFAPIICYMEPSIWMPSQRLQGIAATCWSLQRQFNMRHMKIVDMMDSSIATGYKYLLGSVSDPQDLQQAGQNKLIGIDPENAPEGMNSVQQLEGATCSPALIEYQKVLNELSLTLANVTESTLGIDEKGNTQISGRLAQVRIAQGLRGNRKIMDNVEDAQAILGEICLTAMQENYPAGKIERIIGEKPTEQFYSQQYEQYGVAITEGIRSKSQKDAYYYELVNLKREGIVDVPQAEIVRALSMAGIDDLEKSIEAQDEGKAKQQAQLDAIEQQKLELGNAQKEQMLALAQERRARVQADLALKSERASEAEENRAQAALARAKTITEIAQMQDSRILQVLQFVNQLEQQEAADRDQVDANIQGEANEINSETQGTEQNQNKQAMQQQSNMQQGEFMNMEG